MRAWPNIPLSALCEINPPAPEPSSRSASVTFVPMAAVDETEGHLDTSKVVSAAEVSKGYTGFREDDVLFAKITPCMENGKAAIARGLSGGIGFGSTEFHVLRAGPLLLPDYLFLFVRQEDFRRRAKLNFVGSGGHMRVPESFFGQCSIPLPPLSEQRRIVEILREAEAVRRHQAQAARTAAELIPALLAIASTQRTAKMKLGGFFVLPPNYGTMAVATDSQEGVPCIRVGNIRNNAFSADGLKNVPADKIDYDRHRVKAGDLLLVRAIGSLDHLGKCFVATDEMNGWAFDSHLMRVRLNSELPAHILHAYFSAPTGRRAFLAKARKSAVQYNINAGEFASIDIPAFLLESRATLDVAIDTYEAHRARLSRASAVTSELHASLLAHAFDSSLTARWRDQNAALLATESAARDTALAAKGIKTATVGAAARPTDEDRASIYATPTDGAWTDLTQRQRVLWRYVPRKGAFGVTDLLHAREKERLLESLSEDGFRRELEVFVSRGALIHVSRPDMAAKDEREVFRHYYRMVALPEGEASWNAPAVNALAEQLRARLTS